MDYVMREASALFEPPFKVQTYMLVAEGSDAAMDIHNALMGKG